MRIHQTHTSVVLEISQGAFDEIKTKLTEAGYGHAFMPSGNIDMHGIALKRSPRTEDEKFFSDYAKVRDRLLAGR